MKVVLLENLKRIGSIGEIIDVKRGYARNFLIANKKALYASKENINQVEKIKTQLSKKDNEKKLEAKKIAGKISNKEFTVKKLSTENKELYGSVKPTEISKLIKEKDNLDINPSMIQPVKEIKSLGKFKVKISLHSEIDAEILIVVESHPCSPYACPPHTCPQILAPHQRLNQNAEPDARQISQHQDVAELQGWQL